MAGSPMVAHWTPRSCECDGHAFREAMRLLASPVVVITSHSGGQWRGATVGSFTSVSCEPPLVSFCLRKRCRMHAVMMQASNFAVHILAADDICTMEHFAVPGLTGEQQFAGFDCVIAECGVPILPDALVIVLARVTQRIDAGDHTMIVGSVDAVQHEGQPSTPVVYYRREYHAVGASPRLSVQRR